jgi:hypothetical protein
MTFTSLIESPQGLRSHRSGIESPGKIPQKYKFKSVIKLLG